MATKTELQEEALQLEVDIYHPADEEGNQKELTVKELETALKARKEELADEQVSEQRSKEQARKEAAEATDAMQTEAKKTRRKRAEESARAPKAADVDPDVLKARGLKAPTKADRDLAEKHGYPLVIPDGKAFRTNISFNCSFGGGLRPAGSVVILTPAEATHKREFLEEL